MHVQHAFFDLARARLEARLVHFLLGVVHQRGVCGGGGRGGGVRRPGQTHTPQGHCQSDPLHPPASPSQLSSLGRQPGIGPSPHCTARRGRARHGTYIHAYITTHTHTHTDTHTVKRGQTARESAAKVSSG